MDEGKTNLTFFFQESVELALDVHNQTECRRCGVKVPVGAWKWVRLESCISPLLRPGEVAEVGIQFRCGCGAINLGEPLPTRAKTGELWSLSDNVVQAIGHTCPVREGFPVQKRKNSETSGGVSRSAAGAGSTA